ncbi:MAG TPA: metallophosphoesterase family protein [Usitatibacter sp.]|nr:metallophosphoesterase family protein [Usitatibacter sp.]
MSDTHGLLRAEALRALHGCDRIIHAGDIGGPAILGELRKLAPVSAVRGNNDTESWSHALPERRTLRIEGVRVLVLHDALALRGSALPRGIRVVVSGHSHKPVANERDGVLFVNPGSAGPRRFSLPISLAILEISGTEVAARLVGIAPE